MPKETQELLNMSSDPLDRLLKYVEKNDLEKINELLVNERPDILNKRYPDHFDKSILHIACDNFAKIIDVKTVKTLISLGADVRQCAGITENEVIHSAVAGGNPQVLSLIVESDGVNLNATVNGNTALNLLVRNGDHDTENFKKCLDILLKSEVDVNKADGKGYTPILWAASKGYKDVVRAIMECGKFVDIKTHKLRGKNAREYIEEKHLYPLPLEGRDSNENRIASPLMHITERREEEFLNSEVIMADEATEDGTILQLACKNNMYRAVKKLLELGADETKTTRKYKETPLEIAASEGYHEIFELLIEKYENKDYPEKLLTTLLKNLNMFQDNKTNYKKCLNILLDHRANLRLNEYSDTFNTPLHYSSESADPTITLKLLDKGASLANENRMHRLPVEDIDTETLNAHFDKSISVDKQKGNDKQSIVVKFDYKSLIPTSVETDRAKSKHDYTQINVENNTPFLSETGVIHVMSKIPEMHHLLIHPLIASFIDVKWHRMRWLFLTNLILFLIFCLTFVGYVFVPDDKDTQSHYYALIFSIWLILGLSYIIMVLREFFQLLLSFRTYCCSLSNVLEVVMLIVCFYPIFCKSADITYTQLSSVAMVIIALEMMVLLGQHPTWSTNIVMLRTVAKNFFTFLLWYAVLLIAFVLCFYKLFNNSDDNNANSNSTEDNEQNFFKEPGLTFIKTIVMLTGEFDAGSIDFDSVWNRLIFLLFIFMIPIILFNLLNGLAVSDTQQIKSEAEIIGYRERIDYIVYIENIILGKASPKTPNDCFFQGYSSIGLRRWIPQSVIRKIFLIPDYLPKKSMNVMLYHDGRVLEGNDVGDIGCFDFCSGVKVDKKILKRVKNLLYKRNSENENVHRQIKELQDIIRSQTKIIQQLTSQRNVNSE